MCFWIMCSAPSALSYRAYRALAAFDLPRYQISHTQFKAVLNSSAECRESVGIESGKTLLKIV
ncbi:hypothetical protein SBDP1_610017 [Syntrophobacter sp. SbD1]|nr:hypothetical protein SBDP1_610017 [Syntrophobacter sp. SbD1]